ncbi:MAG: septum formation initiator family protein [Clostridia bacterium]|nr:septum formation initiator family protein [Clostridia bacterium]
MKKKFKINRIIIIGIIIYVLYVIISRQQVLSSYKKEEQNYLDLIAQEKQRNAELLEEKENINSTEFIEEIARDKLGMYLPNERVYIDISK